MWEIHVLFITSCFKRETKLVQLDRNALNRSKTIYFYCRKIFLIRGFWIWSMRQNMVIGRLCFQWLMQLLQKKYGRFLFSRKVFVTTSLKNWFTLKAAMFLKVGQTQWISMGSAIRQYMCWRIWKNNIQPFNINWCLFRCCWTNLVLTPAFFASYE